MCTQGLGIRNMLAVQVEETRRMCIPSPLHTSCAVTLVASGADATAADVWRLNSAWGQRCIALAAEQSPPRSFLRLWQ